MKLPVAILALSIATTLAADWPQWRGPNRNDTSGEIGLLKEWPAGGPKKVWTYENAGAGYSGFSVVGAKLFTMGTREIKGADASQPGVMKDMLLALDAATGKELWATPMGDMLKNGYGDGPRGTPTIDGDYVYAISGEGNIVCAQVADGKIVWTTTMKALGGSTPGWGYTESPFVDGKLVVLTPGGSKGTMAALDKTTGATVWQTGDITEGAQYSSVVPTTIAGKKQYVQLVTQTVFGVDAESGKVAWRSPWGGKVAVIPSPIVKGDEVFISSGYGAGCKKVKINGSEATDVFLNKDLTNHHGGVILVGDYLYGHSDKGGWTCMNFTDGSVKWTDKGVGKGAVGYADGMLYCLGEKDGTVALVTASPDGWKESGRFKLEPLSTHRSPRGGIWPHPVIANGKLYLRDQEFISCYEVKGTP